MKGGLGANNLRCLRPSGLGFRIQGGFQQVRVKRNKVWFADRLQVFVSRISGLEKCVSGG